MKVLLTGAAGQLGRALRAMSPASVELIACTRADLDIGDADAVQARLERERPDLIINAAAYTAVDKAESEPDLARRINTGGPENLARSARGIGARLIHVSTDFVFDGEACSPYRPEAPTRPVSVYGLTKRDGELAVLAALPERSVIVRTAWVYAAEGANFMRTMLRLLGERGAVRVVADQVGTPTAAGPLAEVLWLIAERPQIRGIHHWSDAGVASWYDFAVAIAEEGAARGLLPAAVTVTPIATEDYPTPARRPAYSVLDKRSLAGLGFGQIHWRQRLRETLQVLARG
ncbi:MAG: dTDP-4-dehydrorhamnose reductase [Steroidobacteraceae bacterium]